MASSPAVPQLRGGLGDFFTGLLLPLRSASIVFSSGKVFSLSLLASMVTALAFIAIWYAGWNFSARWVNEGTAWWFAHVFFTILIWIPGALVLPSLALAPLQDPISEATEERCGNYSAPAFS